MLLPMFSRLQPTLLCRCFPSRRCSPSTWCDFSATPGVPFALALEKVCGARGYVMNIYGETSNIVFSGNAEDTEAIYQIVEAYMDDQADDD